MHQNRFTKLILLFAGWLLLSSFEPATDLPEIKRGHNFLAGGNVSVGTKDDEDVFGINSYAATSFRITDKFGGNVAAEAIYSFHAFEDNDDVHRASGAYQIGAHYRPLKDVLSREAGFFLQSFFMGFTREWEARFMIGGSGYYQPWSDGKLYLSYFRDVRRFGPEGANFEGGYMRGPDPWGFSVGFRVSEVGVIEVYQLRSGVMVKF